MRRARRTILVFAAATAICGGSTSARAHSWYPKTCCSDQDCFPADRIERRTDGSLMITAGPVRVVVPPGFAAQPSQDDDVHVCVWRDLVGKYHPRCLFLPGIS